MKLGKHFYIIFAILGIALFLVACNGEDSSTADDADSSADSSTDSTDSTSDSSASDSSDSADISYPEQSIELYVPANPGGATDASARIMAEHIQQYLGGDLVVINEAGGGGTIAFETVRTADPDGYKLLYFHQALHTGYATDRFEHPATDLKAIGTFSAVNQAYVVSADSPWETLDDFVEDARANPGEYSFGAQLSGTTHFMGAMLLKEADIDFKILDFGTESERLSALLGNQVDMVVTSVGNAVEYAASGDFRVLAVLTEERDPIAPDFPTAKEQGYDVVFSLTHTLFGPKDLPDEIVAKLNQATEELAQDEEYISALDNLGHVHMLNDSEATMKFVEEEFEYIQDLGADLGF